MVFDPTVAPRDRAGFAKWYDQQTEWSESHTYDDPDVCSPALQAWFHEMRESFPAMNGPYKSESMDSAVTDYSIGRFVIYAAFAWSVAPKALMHMRDLAAKHRVGFYDVSDTDEILYPS